MSKHTKIYKKRIGIKRLLTYIKYGEWSLVKLFFTKPIFGSIRDKMYYKYNRCFYCGKKLFLDKEPLMTIDHVIPYSVVGNKLGLVNLRCACEQCNVLKGNSQCKDFQTFLEEKCTQTL